MLSTRFNGDQARVIAKIGYAHAVAEYGLDGFEGKEIRDLLLGKRDDVYDFVGSSKHAELNASKRYLHRLSSRVERGYLVSRVGLFSAFGFADYEVVVGHPRSSSGSPRLLTP